MTLEQRIERLEAIEAIKQLKARYFHACDTKQPDRVRDCFAEGDINLVYGRIGSFGHRDELVAVFRKLACHEHIVEMHHGQNPQVRIIDVNTAEATFGLFYHLIDTRQQTVTQLGGFYEDGFTRENGEWKICSSHYEVVSTQIFDLTEGLAKPVFAGGVAPVELDDPGKQAE